jgi:erythromycin esterase-like protein
MITNETKIVKAIEKFAYPLSGAMDDYDLIIEAAKNKNFILIGEATHGTKEFYRVRAEITQRLIEEQNFDAVAVEADWPDAYTVNRYVSNLYNNITAEDSLKGFERFPIWMWRNKEIVKFIEWLYAYNQEYRISTSQKARPVGFYGLDIYSLSTSINAVISYLDKVDPGAAETAKIRYSCLDHFMDSPQTYGYATELKLIESCENELIAQLKELGKKSFQYMKTKNFVTNDEYFCAVQNAKLIVNSENYYRLMFSGKPDSWNIRDKHMFETLECLAEHLSKNLTRDAKIIVWAHNSHVGNAAATEMSKRGELNIGQMVRRNYKDKSLLIGFSTCRGTVTAASQWDAPYQRKKVREPIYGSYEEIFHHVNHKKFLLNLMDNNEAIDLLIEPKLQRAIGVIYRPDSERYSHYFNSCLPEQFDFLLHYDDTHAVEPLGATTRWHKGELDETYPFGL